MCSEVENTELKDGFYLVKKIKNRLIKRIKQKINIILFTKL